MVCLFTAAKLGRKSETAKTWCFVCLRFCYTHAPYPTFLPFYLEFQGEKRIFAISILVYMLERIQKIRNNGNAAITGFEIEPDVDFKAYKKHALRFGLDRIRGVYTNIDTGLEIHVTKNTIKEILNHDYKDQEQLQSIAAIPQIIENSQYIGSRPNHDTKTRAAKFDYFVCGLKIGDISYTVRSVVVEMENGTRYYDHKLTPIEKEKLLDSLFGTTPGFSQADYSGRILPRCKDTILISILQEMSDLF